MKQKNQMKRLARRIWVMVACAVMVMAIFVLQLINFQLVNGEYYLQQAENTQVYNFEVSAARGDIVDRYGRSIATNRTGYKVELSKGMMTGDLNQTLKELVEILQRNGESWNDTLPLTTTQPFAYTVDQTADSTDNPTLARQQRRLETLKERFGKQTYATADELLESMAEEYDLQDYSPEWQRILAGIRYQMELEGFGERNNFTLADDVSMQTVSIIKERSLTLTGAEIVETSTRVYPDGTILPHVMGTVGPIYAEDWADAETRKELEDKGYEMNDLIGHGGLEEALEDALRGSDGIKQVEYGKDGTIHRSWMQTEPQPGNTAVLTVNVDFQKMVDEALEERVLTLQQGAPGQGRECTGGAAVVIDVKTGGILALSNYPSYDLNLYNSNFEEYNNDPGKPLYNRALLGEYTPGSTFKPIVGLKGMLDGLMTPTSTVNCVGAYTLIPGMRPPSCLHSHGSISIYRAIQESCNWYFFDVGRRLGIDNFGEFAKRLGLGVKTGLEVNEAEGHITSSQDEDYTYGYVLMAAIGQQNTQVTPVQLATYCATLANHGVRYKTHLVAALRDSITGELVESYDAEVVDVIEDNVGAFDAIEQGMVQMAQNNSVALRDYPITVAAKTGTPERGFTNEYGDPLYNGALIVYAPVEDPEIAIGIILENSGSGASAAYLARDILDAYFFEQTGTLAPDAAGVLLN